MSQHPAKRALRDAVASLTTAWCPRCEEECVPNGRGQCMFCDSQAVPLHRAPEEALEASRAGKSEVRA